MRLEHRAGLRPDGGRAAVPEPNERRPLAHRPRHRVRELWSRRVLKDGAAGLALQLLRPARSALPGPAVHPGRCSSDQTGW